MKEDEGWAGVFVMAVIITAIVAILLAGLFTGGVKP